MRLSVGYRNDKVKLCADKVLKIRSKLHRSFGTMHAGARDRRLDCCRYREPRAYNRKLWCRWWCW